MRVARRRFHLPHDGKPIRMGLWTPVGVLAAGVVGYVAGRREAAWRATVENELRRLRAWRSGETSEPASSAGSRSRLAFADADEREITERHRIAERMRSEPLQPADEGPREDADVSTLVGNLPTHPELDEHLNPRSY